VSNDGYDRVVELVADHPGVNAEDLVEMASEEGFDADDARDWLADALDEYDVIEFDGKHWVVRKGKYTFGKYDHSEN